MVRNGGFRGIFLGEMVRRGAYGLGRVSGCSALHWGTGGALFVAGLQNYHQVFCNPYGIIYRAISQLMTIYVIADASQVCANPLVRSAPGKVTILNGHR